MINITIVQGNEKTAIESADINQPLTVTLRYTIDPETGVLARSASVRNGDSRPVRIDQITWAVFTLPVGDDYRLHYLTGRYAAEWTKKDVAITPALTWLESRRGSTGHGNNPYFAIGKDGVTSEEAGPVWYGALAWSGSFRVSVGQDNLGGIRIMGGHNPYDFSWTLKPGETLDTPVFYAGDVLPRIMPLVSWLRLPLETNHQLVVTSSGQTTNFDSRQSSKLDMNEWRKLERL